MSKATVLGGGAMSTGTWLGATVATLQSVGTGLALSTNAALAGVGGVVGGTLAKSGAVTAEEPAVVPDESTAPPRAAAGRADWTVAPPAAL